ncbi:helix-turn-helix transcriptional regulator [Fusibacter paucivorans]|uniref:Helix-turn-helix transcriptional regulator n=1 Tax=Fusibacter paucivorans TaxID=76009 RepID=A0ABS5PQM5_9FIRM|nr:helix-turn-helix transcriptional regulator [Fusibacter paucivorans]MBS7526906.1 helix-turn-helix transcriptional regulator [Fusibacter paucivorans]
MVMNYPQQLPWMKINDFLLYIESLSDSKNFSMQVIQKLHTLIPYDRFSVFYVDSNGKLNDATIMGADEGWIERYFDYYSKLEQGNYSLLEKLNDGSSSKIKVKSRDWTESKPNEFITDFIRPQGIKHSVGMMLHDVNDYSCIVFTLERTKLSKYHASDIDTLSIVQPHIENLYRKVLENGPKISKKDKYAKLRDVLTKREVEIAGLLCDGMTPRMISGKLYLSLSTTYKHIANIHTKLDVSNRQELILKLIEMKDGIYQQS